MEAMPSLPAKPNYWRLPLNGNGSSWGELEDDRVQANSKLSHVFTQQQRVRGGSSRYYQRHTSQLA